MQKFLRTIIVLFALCFTGHLAAQVYVPILQETFSKCRSSKIQGGYFSEDTYFTASENADNKDWFTTNAYPSEMALKLGTKTKFGTLLSPALHFAGQGSHKVKVTFRAQLWFTGTKKDTTDIAVAIDGKPDTKQTVDILSSNNVVNRSEKPFELTFDNVSEGDKIIFANGTSVNGSRFFVADIVVSEWRDGKEPVLLESASFHHFNDIMAGAESEVRSTEILAENLAAPIAIDDTGMKNFTVKKANGWDDNKGGKLDITFTPANAGVQEDTLYIESGDKVQRIILAGKAKVYAPEIAEATGSKSDGFTANWQPLAGIDSFKVTVYTLKKSPLVATELMISKYIEGKSNNRALEIFNGTGRGVSLKGYQLRMEQNGSGGLTSSTFSFPDTILANGSTYTIANANFNAVREVADTLIGWNNGGYSNIVTFTGDDAIGLFSPEGKLIDIIGYESMDVNDKVSGDWGTDKSFYRRNNVYAPHDKFYPQEWDIHEMNYAEGFGKHELDKEGDVRNIEKEVIADGKSTSVEIGSLKPETTYYYAVEAFSGNYHTRYTDAAEARTTSPTSIDTAKGETAFRLEGNRLTTKLPTAKLFSANGMEIPTIGNGTFELPAHGIYLLKHEGKAVKIMY